VINFISNYSLTILTFSILNAFDIKKFYGSLKYCPSEYLNGGGATLHILKKQTNIQVNMLVYLLLRNMSMRTGGWLLLSVMSD
jgi:hypothetical protein